MNDEKKSVDEMPVLLRTDANGVVTLTLNRPAQFNSLSEELLEALQSELNGLARDESVRVIVIAANGKAFCAGHDLKQMRANNNEAYYEALFSRMGALMTTIIYQPQPVIARIQGIATAAGCQLVASCDLAVAVDSARFAVSGINVGLFCSTPSVALARNVGRKACAGNAFDRRVYQRRTGCPGRIDQPGGPIGSAGWGGGAFDRCYLRQVGYGRFAQASRCSTGNWRWAWKMHTVTRAVL